MKSTANLYRSKIAIEVDSPWRVGGDFAGIFLTPISASIYKCKVWESPILVSQLASHSVPSNHMIRGKS